MYLEIAALVVMAGTYIYHRFLEEHPRSIVPPEEIKLPRIDEGAPVPLIFGRCRVRAPILVWTGNVVREAGNGAGNGYPTGSFLYRMDQFYVLGIGMANGAGTNLVHGMWAGDCKFATFGSDDWAVLGKETSILSEISASRGVDVGQIGSHVMWFDGNAAQDVAGTAAGTAMVNGGVASAQIPGYRGYLGVLLYESGQWVMGSKLGSSPAYSFECESYVDKFGYPAVGIYGAVGQDSNPVNVIYDVIVAYFGKLGLSTSLIDMPSFQAAATRCFQESHGYSRCWDQDTEARDIIEDVLRQIDGVLFEDPSTGTIKLRLIRNDFDPLAVKEINGNNCEKLSNFAAGGRTNLINKVRIVWTDRANNYKDASTTAQSLANAVGQDGQVNERVIEMRGINYESLAIAVAARELAWLSRSFIKCSAIVNRSFYRTLPGDVVRISWSKPNISGLYFRVASAERGTLEDGKIRLDLVQDPNFVWNLQAPKTPHFGADGLQDLSTVSDEPPQIHIGK